MIDLHANMKDLPFKKNIYEIHEISIISVRADNLYLACLIFSVVISIIQNKMHFKCLFSDTVFALELLSVTMFV